MRWYDALFYAYLAGMALAPPIALVVHVWRGLEPAERARIKRRAPGMAARGILGALKWTLIAAGVFLVELVRFALRENPDPHNRKL